MTAEGNVKQRPCALGRVGETVLGEYPHALMKEMLRAMTEAAEDTILGEAGVVGEDGQRRRRPKVLHPVGALLTHIVPATNTGNNVDAVIGGGCKSGKDSLSWWDARRITRTSTENDIVVGDSQRRLDPVTGTKHGYWSAHVDKANVPEYDISAVLYLSSGSPRCAPHARASTTHVKDTDVEADFGGVSDSDCDVGGDEDGVRAGDQGRLYDFAGGEFTFMDGDAEGDASSSNGVGGGGFSRVVTPVRGRLVVFSSGEENVHAVGRVTAGERVTLNLWLSMDPRVAADDDW